MPLSLFRARGAHIVPFRRRTASRSAAWCLAPSASASSRKLGGGMRPNSSEGDVLPALIITSYADMPSRAGIPISHLALDVPEPLEGRASFLEARNVQVFDDAIGPPSVPRYVLGDLIAEQREREARLAEEAAAQRAPVVTPRGILRHAPQSGASVLSSIACSPFIELPPSLSLIARAPSESRHGSAVTQVRLPGLAPRKRAPRRRMRRRDGPVRPAR
jgi:hypothetical protein